MNVKVSIVIPTYNRPDDLERLIKSIRTSSYPTNLIEIIVVNNGNPLKKRFQVDKLIENETNKGLAFARNQGAHDAYGKYVLFIDDDNVVDKEIIAELVNCLEKDNNLLGIGPLTFYLEDKNKIWFAGASLNLMTTIPTFRREFTNQDVRNSNLLMTDNLHNCFMIRKDEAAGAGWFDPFVFMNGTEFDLFRRMKKRFPSGYLAVCIDAKCFHDVPEYSKNFLRSLGFENKKRVYYFQRNRGLHVGRYGTFINKISLLVLFYPLFLLVYSLLFLYYRRIDYLLTHLKATIDGYSLLLGSFV